MNFDQLIKVFEKAHNYLQKHAVSTVNQSLTVRNWLFGHFIVEYEQNGEDRAKYGTELLKKLADRLSRKISKVYRTEICETVVSSILCIQISIRYYLNSHCQNQFGSHRLPNLIRV